VITQKKLLHNQLSRNRSSKITDVLKLNGTIQNVPYCHVIIVINYDTNNIHISYQLVISRLQDKLFFSYVEFVKTSEKFRVWEGVITPQTPPLIAPLIIHIINIYVKDVQLYNDTNDNNDFPLFCEQTLGYKHLTLY
jgi:hypothetical protein